MAQLIAEELPRDESEIFKDLEVLCTSPGYLYALGYISYFNNLVLYDPDVGLTSTDLQKTYSNEHLVRTETTTLIGLFLKGDIHSLPPDAETLHYYIDKTPKL